MSISNVKYTKTVSAAVLSLSLLALPLVQPVHTASAEKVNNGQTKSQISSKVQPAKAAWDKSSLRFTVVETTYAGISATVINGGSGMKGETVYEVFRSDTGNPKNGEVVASGVIGTLAPGESQELTFKPAVLEQGNYMFKAYQRPGHPGTGVLWSDSITVEETHEADGSNQPERPFDQYFNSDVQGGTATFTVPEGIGQVRISFSSYVYPEGVIPQEDGKPYKNQHVYDNVTKTYGPGTHTVHVDLPESGYWQTDLYLGPVVETLTESGHSMDSIIDADYGSAN
ncbi:hypothetical protein [Paenibacillus durus]|uniref:Uncharacterized protein n=1 Tax=Paenibacillus durus ATCC 35681 TaxID=1333534 RepID=A0A0F7FEE9_PAEDU|nr:hypothetical protein [Paenibacillus durus]AKG37308.1 hypothetical protein VK70_24800 [Paenibacillus durus ATCC 35681]